MFIYLFIYRLKCVLKSKLLMFCTYEQAGLQYGCSYRATALQMQSTEHHDVLTAAPTRQLTVPNATFTESYFST